MRGKREGRPPPTCNFLLLSEGAKGSGTFSFVYFFCLSYFFPLLGGPGEKEKGCLTMIGDPYLGQEMVM